jgi:hypothetical protein
LVELYFGLGGGAPWTMRRLAARYAVSFQAVSQALGKSLSRMRREAGAADGHALTPSGRVRSADTCRRAVLTTLAEAGRPLRAGEVTRAQPARGGCGRGAVYAALRVLTREGRVRRAGGGYVLA